MWKPGVFYLHAIEKERKKYSHSFPSFLCVPIVHFEM